MTERADMPKETGLFVVRRDGLRWRIDETGSDGICRPISGRFWRWITAARLASEFARVRKDGEWGAGRKELAKLHREFGELKWMGADEGWENAIAAVQSHLAQLAA